MTQLFPFEHVFDFFLELDLVLKCTRDDKNIGDLVDALVSLRERQGRLFVLGVGGSAANAIHVVSDLRKLASVEAYSFDNLAELTARTNDDGWDSIFINWLLTNRVSSQDALLILSVGGGSGLASYNLVKAARYALDNNIKVYSIVGKPDGFAGQHSDLAIIIPENKYTTPIAEAMQMVIMHCVVSHPKLQVNQFKWK